MKKVSKIPEVRQKIKRFVYKEYIKRLKTVMANKNIKEYGKKTQFTSENQPSGKAKALGKLKAKTLEEIKNSILDKSFKLIDEKLDDEEITSSELLAIFNKAVEMSGFKKDKIDTTIKSYSLFEEETENKAINLESEQQSKKTNKK